MAVLERTREGRAAGREALELLAVVAEADDQQRGRRGRAPPRAGRGRPCSGAACRSRGSSGGRPRRTPPAARRCPRPGAARSRCRGSADRPRASASRSRSASSRGWGVNSSTSTPGGTSCTRSTWPTTSSSTERMCSEPTKTASAPASVSLPHRSSSSLPRIEYSSSEPCALTAKRAPDGGADGRAEQDVVGEDEVGGELGPDGGGVGLDVAALLLVRPLLQQLGLAAPRSGRARRPAAARRGAPGARRARRRGRAAPDAAPGRRRPPRGPARAHSRTSARV